MVGQSFPGQLPQGSHRGHAGGTCSTWPKVWRPPHPPRMWSEAHWRAGEQWSLAPGPEEPSDTGLSTVLRASIGPTCLLTRDRGMARVLLESVFLGVFNLLPPEARPGGVPWYYSGPVSPYPSPGLDVMLLIKCSETIKLGRKQSLSTSCHRGLS